MRGWIVGLVGFVLAVGLFGASPFVGLYRLGSALHATDAEAILERIDVARVRRSIVEAIVEEVGRDEEVLRRLDKLGGIGREMALRAAAAEFDRQLAITITPDLLRVLIADGRLPPELDAPAPAEGDAGPAGFGVPDDPLRHVLDWEFVSPRKFRTVIGEPGRPEDATGLVLRLQGFTWRLAEVELPPSLLARIRPALKRRIDALRS